MSDNEQGIYTDLRNSHITRLGAIRCLIDLGHTYPEAQRIVDEWIDGWELQKDCDEESESGWSV